MVTQSDQSVVRNNTVVEFERSYNKSYLVKHTLGSLFPGVDQGRVQRFHEVLEIGCGPGGWVTDVAQTYYISGMRVTGIDSNANALEYAKKQADDRKLDNASFYQVERVSGPYTCLPSGYFDSISGQFLSKLFFPHDWEMFLGECTRLLKPGGMLQLTEFEMGFSDAPAHEELVDLFLQAMRLTGRSHSPTNRHLGLLCRLEPMLQDAYFGHTTISSKMINYSKGALQHREWIKDFLILTNNVLPLLVELKLVTQERADALYCKQLEEVEDYSFHALLPIVTVTGTKEHVAPWQA